MTRTAPTPSAPLDSVAPAAPAPSRPFGARFLAPLLIGSTLNPINSSMLATGLVGIGVDFGTGPGTTAMLISVLYLCSAVAQPTMGKLAMVFGPRRVFLSGIAVLLLAGLVGAFAPTFATLLVSRALIGVGTSAAYPTAMALVRRRADALAVGVPSRVLGNFSITAQVTMVFGLPIGGVLTGAFGWRALFAVNVPLAVVALVLTLRGVAPDPPRERRTAAATLHLVDLPGIALFAGTVVALLVFLQHLAAPTWWLLAVVVVLGGLLWLRERAATSPLLDVRMLARNAPLRRTYLRQLLVGLGTYTAIYGASQWMEQSAGHSSAAVGVLMLPLSALSVVVARTVSNRGWVRGSLTTAGVALVLTAGVMLLMRHDSPVVVLIGMSLLFGCANGFSGFANQATLYVQTTADEIAVASGLQRTFNYLGAIFSASLISLTFGDRATDAGFHTLAWVIGGIGVTVALMSVLDRQVPRRTGGAGRAA